MKTIIDKETGKKRTIRDDIVDVTVSSPCRLSRWKDDMTGIEVEYNQTDDALIIRDPYTDDETTNHTEIWLNPKEINTFITILIKLRDTIGFIEKRDYGRDFTNTAI